jgi:hypothetical protein
MLARTRTGSLIVNATSMTKEGYASEPVFCPWRSGLCFFPNIIQVSLTGPRSKPTKHALMPTSILSHTKRAAP